MPITKNKRGLSEMLYINEDGTIRLTRGEVANAPWGATNATITYNYTAE